jgi:anaphase-promoting complex subunit 6
LLELTYKSTAVHLCFVHNVLLLCRNQQYAAAQQWFTRALELVPGCTITPAWEATVVNLAHVLRKQQQYSRALQLYEQAIGLHPHNPSSYVGLAYTHQLMGNSEAAVEGYHKALGLRPDDAFAAEMLGAALREECARFGHMLMENDRTPGLLTVQG